MTDTHNDELTERHEQQQQKYRQIGAELRKRRKSQGLDQRQVGEALHLPGMVINDLETGRIEHLSSLYRRGYIRNYARLLNLDPAALLDEADENLPPLQQVMPADKGQWRLERYLKIATYAIVTIAIVPPIAYFFIAGGSRMIERDTSLAETPLIEQGNGQPAAHSSLLSSRQEPSSKSDAGHVSASVLPLSPIRPLRKPEQLAPGAEAQSDEAAAVIQPAPLLSNQIRLELLEDSWIEIQDSAGTRLEYDLLRAGQQRMYQGEPPFRLLLGRSSSVAVELNGKAVSWEGQDSADVARIRILADGTVER